MPFNLSNPDRMVHAGVVLMNSETELLDLAPIDLLNGLSKDFVNILPFPDELKAQALDITFHWVTEHGEKGRLTAGMTVKATDSFASCPPLDVMLIGAHHGGYVPNEAELAYVRKAYDECSACLLICGGFMTGLRAGILDGKTATAPRDWISKLAQEHPGTNWVEKRYVQDGKLWTSGTLLNGLDLMRAFAIETWGMDRSIVYPLLEIGHWPVRDVDYRDVDGKM